MTELVASKVCLNVGDTPIVRNASLSLRPGELVAILGPNGAGKTSLLRTLLGISKTTSGSADLNGEDCFRISPSERARIVSYLPQQRPLAWPYRVYDVVALGRFAHGSNAFGIAPGTAMLGTNSHDGRFIQDNALPAGVDQSIGGAKINGEVVGK